MKHIESNSDILTSVEEAHYYKNDPIYGSELKYRMILENILDSSYVKNAIDALQLPKIGQIKYFGNSKEISFLLDLIGSISLEYVTYFASTDNETTALRVLKYASNLFILGYPNSEALENVESLLRRVQKRLSYISNGYPDPDAGKSFMCNRAPVVDYFTDQLKEEIGVDNWEKLQLETRKGLVTASICFDQLTGLSLEEQFQLDFSAIVLPLLKSLEYELRLRFGKPYIMFLRENYSPEDFINVNAIRNPVNKDIRRFYSNILRYDYGSKCFTYTENYGRFTLGTLDFMIGLSRPFTESGNIDNTMIDYCQNSLISHPATPQQIKRWLISLSRNVQMLRQRRNKSAHGGETLDQIAAEEQ